MSWTPLGGAINVPRDTVIRIVFDDYPDPDTVGLAGVIVTTGVYYHGGTYGVDIVDKAITFRASGTLRAQLTYNVTVQPDLLSLHGCGAIMEQRTFRTAATSLMPAPVPEPPLPLADVLPIFAASCGGGACHRALADEPGAPDGGCLAAPAAGLSLCDSQARDALVGVRSRQVRSLALVKRNDSARSYLLRKLLAGDAVDRPAPQALGHRDPPGAPLTTAELRLIARWIDTGANP